MDKKVEIELENDIKELKNIDSIQKIVVNAPLFGYPADAVKDCIILSIKSKCVVELKIKDKSYKIDAQSIIEDICYNGD